MIFVTVGTHEQPFNRLIQKIDELKKDGTIQDDVIIQTGFSTYEPKYCQWSKLIPYQQMVKNVADARIVITHGGPASFIMPLQVGKTPIVVPRQHQFTPIGNHYESRCKYLYGYTKQDDIRRKSSSGGLFYELSQVILEDGGVVFGACYDKEMHQVVHKSTEETSIENMLKSKYAESKLGDTYKKIETYLKDGKKVLFCGTPCQAAGLYNLKEKKWSRYKNQLFILDFLCEGVPSYKIFQEYIKDSENKSEKEIETIEFRSKSYGWNVHCMKIQYKDGTSRIIPSFSDSYMHTFIMDLTMNRRSCYACPFREKKYSDVTIGDFWKVSNVDKSCVDNKGVSAIFVNSEAGNILIEKARKNLYIKELEDRDILQMEQHLDTSLYLDKRNNFYTEFLSNGYNSAIRKYSTCKVTQQAYFSAEEMYRNAYEDACAKYLDRKIDVERFEKIYKQEIYKLVNDPQQKEFYATNQTTYASTVAVYKKWFSQS